MSAIEALRIAFQIEALTDPSVASVVELFRLATVERSIGFDFLRSILFENPTIRSALDGTTAGFVQAAPTLELADL